AIVSHNYPEPEAIVFNNSNEASRIKSDNSNPEPDGNCRALVIIHSLGLKQAELADVAGVSHVAAHKWFRGKTKPDIFARKLIAARWPMLTVESWGPLAGADSEAAHFLAPTLAFPALNLEAPGALRL